MNSMIMFDTSLYQEKAVMQAVEDYREIAGFRCWKTEKGIGCSLERNKYDPEITCKEFSNYVLCLSIGMNGAEDDLR